MTDEEKRIFAKYAFTGSYDVESTISLLAAEQEIVVDSAYTNLDDTVYRIGRQYYLYSQLLEEPSRAKRESLLIYLENLKSELIQQYTRKTQMESKAGFVLAAWGVFTVFVLDKLILSGRLVTKLNVLSITSMAVGIFALLGLLFVVLSKQVSIYNFNNKWNDYYVAMEHPQMVLVRFAEGYRNAYQDNEKRLKLNGNILNLAIVLMLIYVILVCILCGGNI